MSESDAAELGALLTEVMKYHRQPLTPTLLDMWLGGLAPYSLDQCRRALNLHTRDPERGMFPPKIADLVRILVGTKTDRAAVAWAKVYDNLGGVGAYQDVAFDDPVIHAVIHDMGGWSKLCRGETADLSYVQHRFSEHYRALSERGVEGYPRVLHGDRAPDSEYERRGLTPPTPILIGDPVKAAQVVAGGGAPRSQTTALPPGTSVADLVRLGGGIGIRQLLVPGDGDAKD